LGYMNSESKRPQYGLLHHCGNYQFHTINIITFQWPKLL
jgi:hypothetical protein